MLLLCNASCHSWPSSTRFLYLQISLSERNTVELIIKLKELGFIGNELLYTANGREYVTKDKLVTELRDIVEEHGGRLALVDVPSLLGMDLGHCQAAAETLAKEHSSRITLAQGEIFSLSYFKDLANEIEEKLQSTGVLPLSDVARSHGLSMDMLSSEVSKALGTIIHGKMDGIMLYTDAYITRVRCQIRGALRGALQPVQMSVLKQDFGVEGPAAFFPGLVDDVIAAENLKGRIVSGSWIPNAHLQAQQEAVSSFYSQNHYVSKEYAKKHGVTDSINAYMKGVDPDAILLDTVYVSPQLVHSLIPDVEERVQEEGFCNMLDVVPIDFSAEDASGLLQQAQKDSTSSGVFSHTDIFCDTIVVSHSMIEDISENLRQEATKRAKEEHVASTMNKEVQPESGKSAKAGKKKGKKVSAVEETEEDEDSWDMGKGKKGKGRGKKKAKGAERQQQQQPMDETSSAVKSKTFVIESICRMYPDMEDQEEFLSSLAANMLPAVSAAYDKAANEIFTAGASRRRELKEHATSLLQGTFYSLQNFSKGIEVLFEKDEVQKTSAERHLIKTLGSTCSDALLHFLSADMSQHDEEDMAAKNAVRRQLDQAERNVIIQQCPSALSKALSDVVSATRSNQTMMQDFQNQLLEAAEESGIRLKTLDKKTESSLAAQQKETLSAQVEGADAGPVLLAAAVPLLILTHMKACVILPGKSLAPAIQSLKEYLEEEDATHLENLHKQVIDELKSEESCVDSSLSDKVRALALSKPHLISS